MRRPMVRWLDPHQLVDTAVRVLLSGVFSSYADSRQLQALEPAEVPDHSGEAHLWLDYVADLGDGWNSTYTVARLLATEDLKLDWDGETHSTERGRILVMGGDQVYPVPNAVEYENRMLGPYRAALPCVPGEAPELFAIPGSHDWYDGLVNFISIFCRNHWIGGWRTRQHRSYFALKLPHGWWLWGIDIQFGSYIDEAQLQYFADVTVEQVQPGDRIILCMAKEVESGRKRAEIHSDRDVEYLEREIIQPSGAQLLLYLKSGKHYYARYEEEKGCRQHITSGGGGAFLHPTHNLPEQVDLPGAQGTISYRRAGTYPSPVVSKRLRKRIWLLPPYNLPLAAVFGTVQVLLAFMLGLHLGDRHVSLGLGDLRRAVWESPTSFLLILLMIASLAGMVRFAHEVSGAGRFLLGMVHSTLQIVSVAGVMLVASWLSSALGLQGVWSLIAFLAMVGVLGGIAGTVGLSGYLWATNCLGLHGNEGYAPLHHQDLKHFLRLHIEADGSLTVYPIGVNRIGRKWILCPDAPAHAPWFAPHGSEPQPHLIEKPITINAQPNPGNSETGPKRIPSS
ncbi:MAG: metallophosphoesterase [Actinomycetota bacterium]|nr:metallophosphoesterase [Actinomycetota bacterium]